MKIKPVYNKLILSGILILIGILAYTSVIDNVLQKTFLRELDNQGSQYFNETTKRAVYTFAVVRGINGVISVLQGTSVSVSPAGVGMQVAAGEILDPINDLMERFSWVMLISGTSLGIQKILMEMGTWLGFKILLSFSMFLMLIGIWFSQYFKKINLITAAYKLMLISIIIRFCIPSVAIASEKVYELFLKERYAKSIESLEQVSNEIKGSGLMDDEIVDGESGQPGYLDRLKQMYHDSKEIVGIKGKLIFLKDKISDYTQYTIDLIIVFLLQTVLIPIVVLWILIRVVFFLYEDILSFKKEKT